MNEVMFYYLKNGLEVVAPNLLWPVIILTCDATSFLRHRLMLHHT